MAETQEGEAVKGHIRQQPGHECSILDKQAVCVQAISFKFHSCI